MMNVLENILIHIHKYMYRCVRMQIYNSLTLTRTQRKHMYTHAYYVDLYQELYLWRLLVTLFVDYF